MMDGSIEFLIEIRIDAAEMRDWPAERIAQFFAGVAMMLRAQNDTLPVIAGLLPPPRREELIP